jgi:hypothetical protein
MGSPGTSDSSSESTIGQYVPVTALDCAVGAAIGRVDWTPPVPSTKREFIIECIRGWYLLGCLYSIGTASC